MLPEIKMRYCEAHITVKPQGHFGLFAENVRTWGWKASTFEVDEVDDAAGLWFLSARANYPDQIMRKLEATCQKLNIFGYQVLRAKTEQTLFDTKLGDKLENLHVT